MGQFFQLLLLASAIATAVYSSVSIDLSVVPNQMEIGLTNDLTITCKASINSSDTSGMMFLSALVIFHNANDSLASVSIMTPNGTAIPPFTGPMAVKFDQTGDSYIEIIIENVDFNDTGKYWCEGVGMNMYNHLQRAKDETTIYAHKPDSATYVKEINAIESKLKNLTSQIGRWSHVDKSPLFAELSYGGKTYLVSKSKMGPPKMCQFMCFVQGGYLAEINDVDEFGALQSELMAEFNGTRYYDEISVWLGTSEVGQSGKFVHEYHPKDPVYYEWGAPYAGFDCMAMTAITGFKNEERDCDETGRCLCELIGGHI